MSAVLDKLNIYIHESTLTGDFIVQISRLSMTALILIFWMKRPEIDEICRNALHNGVNGKKLYKTQRASYVILSF